MLNEETRLDYLTNYYSEFDIVLLDGGSSDKTLELANKRGVTVFKRIGEIFGEAHFVEYLNKYSRSRSCFYLMADEYVPINQLRLASNYLLSGGQVVYVRKIEWMYGCCKGFPSASSRPKLVRGVRSGLGFFDINDFHNSLKTSASENQDICAIDLHHFHIKSVKDEYGKVGAYLNHEVGIFMGSSFTLRYIIRRYFVPVFVLLAWRAWNMDIPLRNKFFLILEHAAVAILALMTWIEKKYFLDSVQQRDHYSKYYK